MARRLWQSQSCGGVRERKRRRQKRGEDDPHIPSRINYIEVGYARNATCTLYLERAKDLQVRIGTCTSAASSRCSPAVNGHHFPLGRAFLVRRDSSSPYPYTGRLARTAADWRGKVSAGEMK
ncbi:hypothetical protein C8R44DRAFT_751414 [Mycena epipterygia]|nr:hypothetical protein C8R44DRAFT_751414 [Mycena epipterygia]